MDDPDFDRLLDEAVAVTHVEQFRGLCSPANTSPPPNDRDTWRQFIASGRWRASYPGLATQAGNALGALGRAAAAVATGQPVAVAPAEQGRRLAICRACERFDREQARCLECGCHLAWKVKLATEHCPLDPPKW